MCGRRYLIIYIEDYTGLVAVTTNLLGIDAILGLFVVGRWTGGDTTARGDESS